MNTNPDSVKILCFGDSNTWGQKPDRSGRNPADVRWTGVLQNLLGDKYYVVEEGLGGRTIDLDLSDRVGRNGKTYLTPCLQSHNPIDIAIIMLGTNDLKIFFDTTPESIKQSLSGLVDDVQEYATDKDQHIPQIILMSPAHINGDAPRFKEFYIGFFDEKSVEKSRKLADAIKKLCEDRDLSFIDAAKYSKVGEDGLHLDLDSHAELAQAIASIIIS